MKDEERKLHCKELPEGFIEQRERVSYFEIEYAFAFQYKMVFVVVCILHHAYDTCSINL